MRAVFRIVFDYYVLDIFWLWIIFHCCAQGFVDICFVKIMYCCLLLYGDTIVNSLVRTCYLCIFLFLKVISAAIWTGTFCSEPGYVSNGVGKIMNKRHVVSIPRTNYR